METLDEFQSITTGYGRSSSLKYQTYYDLLIMHVLDMIEPRKQMLQKEVTSTKQPSHKPMIILSVKYRLKLQLVIHTWVLIHPVMNFIISTQINLVHLFLPDINFNPDYSEQIQTQNLLDFQSNQPDRHRLVLYTCQDIYINF